MTGVLAEKISAVFVHHMLHRNDVKKMPFFYSMFG